MNGRFEKVKFLLSEKATLYPVLTGILFLLNELRNNANFYAPKENISLILIILTFTLFIDFLSHKLIKNRIKAALIAVSFITINLFYRDIISVISGRLILMKFVNLTTSNHPEVIIIPALLFALLTYSYIVLRTNRLLKSLNLYLNVVLIAFVLLEITLSFIITVPEIKLSDSQPFPVNTNLLPEQKPDIYYIILDTYTNSESLMKYWNYDNSKFENSLLQLGFIIAHKSKTDFTSTPYCLASYLNSSSLILDSTKNYNYWNLLQLIRNNRLYDWLNLNKYKCYNFSPFDTFGIKKYYNFLRVHYLGRTSWFINSDKLNHYLRPSTRISQTNLNIFDTLNHQSEKIHDKPIFAYAHVMMPHSPYYFDEYGKPYKASSSLTEMQKYLGQLIYTNTLTLNSINQILKFSPRKPIIVIQGDHGYRGIKDAAHKIFYAIYTPDRIIIPDTINPENTFKNLVEYINHRN